MDIAKKLCGENDVARNCTSVWCRPLTKVQKRCKRARNKSARNKARVLAFKDC